MLQSAGLDWRANIYGGAKHAFWARPKNFGPSTTERIVKSEATVPGVGYHPIHAARAWQAVLDQFEETLGALPKLA